jgi:HAD superfamily hydrolase (TIGR01509 family)
VRFKLVIFDCDGTLIDSEPIANRVLRDQLELVGISMPLAEIMRTFVGKTREQCIALAEELSGRALPPDFAQSWDTALFAALRAEVKPVEGIPELLPCLPVPWCVASNGSPERTALALEAAGLMPWVKGKIHTASEVANPKPAPDLFLHVAREMGSHPRDCVVIEDTTTGVKAAVAAGIAVFAYAGAPHADANALRAAGATTFTAMRDLPALLEAA